MAKKKTSKRIKVVLNRATAELAMTKDELHVTTPVSLFIGATFYFTVEYKCKEYFHNEWEVLGEL